MNLFFSVLSSKYSQNAVEEIISNSQLNKFKRLKHLYEGRAPSFIYVVS